MISGRIVVGVSEMILGLVIYLTGRLVLRVSTGERDA